MTLNVIYVVEQKAKIYAVILVSGYRLWLLLKKQGNSNEFLIDKCGGL